MIYKHEYALTLCIFLWFSNNLQSAQKSPKPFDVTIERAINFTRKPNACYLASMMQALIAVPAWRKHILNYPPADCTDVQPNHTVLTDLQTLIQEYASQSQKSDHIYSIDAFYDMCWQQKIVTNYKYSDAIAFVDTLQDKFTSSNNYTCYLTAPFINIRNTYMIRKNQSSHLSSEDVSERLKFPPNTSDILNYISLKIPMLKPIETKTSLEKIIADAFILTLQYQRNIFRLNNIPHALWFSFYFSLEDMQSQTISRLSIPQIIDMSPWIEKNISSGHSIYYQLVSVIWQNTEHLISYVYHGNSWYRCDDLGGRPCSQVMNAQQDFQNGVIAYPSWGPMYTRALFYQLIEEEAIQHFLPELHNELALLAI